MTLQQAFDLALAHHQAGRLVEAEHGYRQVLAVAPRHADALHLLGVIASQVGRHDLAVELIRQAIAVNAHQPDWHSNLGEAYHRLGHLPEAIAAYRRALELQPNLVEAWSNLGYALWSAGRSDEAVAACRRALGIRPDFAQAHHNLGNALRTTGCLEEAVAAYRRALDFQPENAETHSNLGRALSDQGQFDAAIAAYQRAIHLRPDFAEAHLDRGNALREQGRRDDALAEYRRASQLDPSLSGAHNNLGNILADRGEIEAALAAYRQALQSRPDDARAHSNLLLALHYPADADPAAIFAEHRRWDEIHARPLAQFIAAHTNDPQPDRRLKIGYVSPDFREHAVAYFLESLLTHHDRAQVEVFCYEDLARPDAFTERLRGQAAHWRKIRGLTDAQAADLIRRDGIDLLVDLAGHTANNRLPVFARRPAPVQVTYLGYCDTTGMKAMDYRLTDALADPAGTTEHLHSETLTRLPDCAWCFRPPDDAPPVSAPPILHTGHVTFGCFNALPKITDAMLTLWSRLLHAVPGSHLLLKNLGLGEPPAQARIRALLEKAGIAAARVALLGRAPSVAEHLATYARVDLALDTFPYHGTTTTCEALWMGVPVITLAGQTHASRVGVSLLTNVGLPELIANDLDDHLHRATQLASDVTRLADLRSTLRGRMAASPLMDAPRFARNIETAYRDMWQQWGAGRSTA